MPLAETALARLTDEVGIRDTIARFADAATRGDFPAFHDLWSADAVWEIPAPFQARAEGVEAVVAMFHHLWDGKDFFVQFAQPGAIEITGDEATTRCIIHEAARGPGGIYYRNFGVFHDRLRRSGDRWVFTCRRFQFVWLDTSPFTGDAFPLTPHPQSL